MAIEEPLAIKTNPRLVIDSYNKFVQRLFPDTKAPLSVLLKDDPNETLLCKYLQEYLSGLNLVEKRHENHTILVEKTVWS